MTVTPALTAGEQTALSGPSTRRTYLSVVPQTTVATVTVNQTVTFPVTQLTVSGSLSGVKKDMTAIIKNGSTIRGRYRVRKDPSGSTLYLMEFGAADPGQLATNAQTCVQNGDTIEIVDDPSIYAVLPRIAYSPPLAEIFEDYAELAAAYVQYPTPIVNVKINDSRGGHYATKVADGATVAITATISVQHWPTSASATYSWTVPGTWTSVSGTTSATLTGTAPVGNHVLKCTVTPNLGNAIEVIRRVQIHDDSTNPAMKVIVTSDTRDRTGRRVVLSLLDNRIASIPEGAMVILFDAPTWNGSATSVPTATTVFVGWFSRVRFNIGEGTRDAEPEIVGPAGVLSLIGNTSQEWNAVSGLPLTWQSVRQNCSNLNFILWWLLTFRASNLLRLFNYHPISVSATSARNVKFEAAKGSVLSQLQGLARRYGEANFGANSGGEFFFARHPNMIPTTSRSTDVVTRDTLTAAKYGVPISFEKRQRPDIRSVEAAAFWWDGISAQPTPYRSLAPETAAQGTAEEEITDLLIDGTTPEDTIRALSGLRLAWRNAAYAEITIPIPRNRDVYEPAEMSFVNVTIPANLHPLGTAWTFNGTPIAVTKRHLPGGSTDIELTLEIETSGARGKFIPNPPPGSAISPGTPDVDPGILDDTPDLDWGPDIDIVPDTPQPLNPKPGSANEYSREFLATLDGYVAQLDWSGSGEVYSDRSPSNTIRQALSDLIWMERNPHNTKDHVLFGKWGMARTLDLTRSAPDWRIIRDAVSSGISTCGALDLTTLNGSLTIASLPTSLTGFGGFDPLEIGEIIAGTGWRSTTQQSSPTPGTYLSGIGIHIEYTCPVKWSNAVNFTGSFNITDNIYVQAFYKDAATGLWVGMSGSNVAVVAGSGTYTSTSFTTNTNYASEVVILFRRFVGSPPVSPEFTITDLSFTGTCTFDPCGTLLLVEEFIGDLVALQDKPKGWMWLTKRLNADGVHYDVYFNRTLDDFTTVWSVRLARWASNMVYSIAPCPHDCNRIYVSAGDPTNSDAYVYYSADGGGTFTATTRTLTARGGPLLWNWSTGTPNTPNEDASNLVVCIGLDGSNNYKVAKGISGTPVTVATGSGKYPIHARALWSEPRDGDNLYLVFQDRSVYKSTNYTSSWSAVTSVPGSGIPRGCMGWPADATFLMLFGEDAFGYTADSAATITSLLPNYSAFATSAFGSGKGETIVAALPYISSAYPTPVIGGAS